LLVVPGTHVLRQACGWYMGCGSGTILNSTRISSKLDDLSGARHRKQFSGITSIESGLNLVSTATTTTTTEVRKAELSSGSFEVEEIIQLQHRFPRKHSTATPIAQSQGYLTPWGVGLETETLSCDINSVKTCGDQDLAAMLFRC
jgi:hypothetical protein